MSYTIIGRERHAVHHNMHNSRLELTLGNFQRNNLKDTFGLSTMKYKEVRGGLDRN